ncbi:unnamed protein product [Rotaria magnacalcarata]|uniref:Small acidic protein n=1 Tax=Rotaria magnacalcarata TaxID=392030 RepID=A0A815TLT7_9BILA|nr:unnamed protein product [Rotaria magnacalcarata]CAF2082038.1 unnamed protein product [Rotaria magnacalcarata]CAF2211695.1 unnamed protein product [Rotaria magnacalcarata]CAF4000371.1 unnamed protein product [Rotaria magnacalcarata]CAF4011756.1 unnamed protein product [Rotaria magnacalcarata]
MSITSKKKVSASPQHSMKEHHDQKTDDNNREKAFEIDKISIEEIHTTNDWEHADLGDEERKQKFLRLMGAKKRKDDNRTSMQDSFSINHDDALLLEKKHSRSRTENEAINLGLEKQFNESLQSNILHTHHEGLGFQGGDISIPSSSNDCHNHPIKTKFVPASPVIASSTLNETISQQLGSVKNK